MALNNMAVDKTTGKVLTGDQQVQANHEKYKEKFKDANADLVNAETFLSLLVAEMTNQDPLEPTSNTEFITQMAQFSQLQYLQDNSTYTMSNYATSLVGKTVTVSQMIGADKVDKTGVVSEVKKVGDEFKIIVDGVEFDLKSVQSVTDSGTASSGGTISNTGLGELIAKASAMIGMYAEVKPASNNGLVVYDGFIESVKVKDGKVNVVINNTAYDLDDIVEVYYATIVPDEPTNPDDGANGDNNGDETVDTDNTTDTGNTGGDTTDKELDAETAAATGAVAAEEMVYEAGRIEPEDEGEDLADLNTEGIV
ncbi:MAG: hypothetical protein K2O14_00725 [Oscillospiraceae bacterium]|nr:hypothetical protein [Oscillospiraceae bacterium]